MARVRMHETVDTPTHRYPEGEEVEMDDKEAAAHVEGGRASRVGSGRERAIDKGASGRERATTE